MSLFDAFLDERYYCQFSSIQHHLSYLLNTKQGSIQHLPDYGVPDLSAIYQNLPESIYGLTQCIEKAIIKFEPRIRQVTVNGFQVKHSSYIIKLTIAAMVHSGEKLKVNSYCESGGRVVLKKEQFT